MLITKNVNELETIIRSTPYVPHPAQPQPDHQQNIAIKELWQTLTNWERDFKLWSEEYRALKKIAALQMVGKKRADKGSDHPFLRLEILMEETYPILQKALRAFRMDLRILRMSETAIPPSRFDEMRKLNQRLDFFKREVSNLKLDFFDILFRTMPIAFS